MTDLQTESQKEYEEMMEELEDKLGVKVQECIEEHDTIVRKYGFDDTFIEFVEEL